MTTLTKIKALRLSYKAEGNKKLDAFFSSILGDFQNAMTRKKARGEEEEIRSILRFYLAGIQECKMRLESSVNGTKDPRYLDLLAEEAAISPLIPKFLSLDELTSVIEQIIKELATSDVKHVGLVMKALKARYEGLFDGKLASELATQLLSDAT